MASDGVQPHGSALIEALNLVKEYPGPRKGLVGKRSVDRVLDGVCLSVKEGEIFGVVGESGAGKSTLIRLLLALEQPTSGSIAYAGEQISGKTESELRFLRREVQIVFQDPGSSLDPRMRIGQAVVEPLRALNVDCDHNERLEAMFADVGLTVDVAHKYPGELSGGLKQRVALARALITRPRVLIADEPVSAVDVSVRAQILNLILALKQNLNLTVIFISHDMAVVRYLCDRMAVLYRGVVVESGLSSELYSHPTHPYTKALLAAIPHVTSG